MCVFHHSYLARLLYAAPASMLSSALYADGSSQQQPGGQAAAALASTISDEDVLRAHHRFLRAPEDDEGEQAASWGARLARKYYARLFKEFAIADLSR
jgi:hypothetical protein